VLGEQNGEAGDESVNKNGPPDRREHTVTDALKHRQARDAIRMQEDGIAAHASPATAVKEGRGRMSLDSRGRRRAEDKPGSGDSAKWELG
jgi:hypothetical protein